jgi:hypothetical protein
MVFFLLLWFSPYFLQSRFFVWVGENATCNPQLSQKSILEGDTNASVRAKLGGDAAEGDRTGSGRWSNKGK